MDFSDLVGLPFAHGGRTKAGCDCWGLGVVLYRDGLGIELPTFDGIKATGADRAELYRILAQGPEIWRELKSGDERPYDGVLMRLAGEPHIGWVVGAGYMLHARVGLTSAIEPYGTGRFGRTVETFFRHELHR